MGDTAKDYIRDYIDSLPCAPIDIDKVATEREQNRMCSPMEVSGFMAIINKQKDRIDKLEKQLNSALTMSEMPMLDCDKPD